MADVVEIHMSIRAQSYVRVLLCVALAFPFEKRGKRRLYTTHYDSKVVRCRIGVMNYGTEKSGKRGSSGDFCSVPFL